MRFCVELDYKKPRNAFILLRNLVLVIANLIIINNKLKKDVRLCYIISVYKPKSSFISSSLDLILKHDSGFYKIHHPFYLKSCLVNDYILDTVEKLIYTKFQKVLELILAIGRSYIIIKKDIKDIFCNIPIPP